MKTPEELIQDQVNAYNARDLQAFLACYAEEVVWIKDGQEQKLGKAELRERFGKLFRENPGLHCDIRKREAAGNIVIDDEHVTGLAAGGHWDVRVSYVVERGIIRRVTFMRL